MKSKLTDGSIAWHLVKLNVPILSSIFIIVALNLVDTYFIAQLGTNELAAVSFTFPIITVVGSLLMGLGEGTASVIAVAIGESNRYKVQRLTTDCLILSLLLSIILTLVALATIEPLFKALNAKPNILALIREYISIWYLGLVFLIVPAMGGNAIRASGNIKFISLSAIVPTIINAVLDPLLIFGEMGFPRLELQGAALATVIAQSINLVLTFIFLYREEMIVFALPKFKDILKSWWNVLHICISATATKVIKPLCNTLIASMIAVYGTEAVAGFGIASLLESLTLIIFFALSASLAPVVGQNWGAGKFVRVNQALDLSLRFCLIWGLLAAIVLTFAAGSLVSLFNNNPQVVSTVINYMAIVPISYGAAGIIQISNSTFIALGKSIPSIAIAITHMLILYVPLAELGRQLFGVQGIFAAVCFSNLVVGLGAFAWNRRTLHIMMTENSLYSGNRN